MEKLIRTHINVKNDGILVKKNEPGEYEFIVINQ